MKSREALEGARRRATRAGHPEADGEHLLAALPEQPDGLVGPSPAGRLLAQYRVTRERFLSALTQVRGNQRVTTDAPEADIELTPGGELTVRYSVPEPAVA